MEGVLGQTKIEMSKVEDEKLFKVGTQVEVSRNEEGWKNQFFKCKIIYPPKSETRKNSKKGYYWVEYKTIVDEKDHSKQFVEYVNASFIRPLPPSAASSCVKLLEKGDFVEAFHRGGWWLGVILEVMHDGLEYLVALKSPYVEIVFRTKQLRVPLVWLGGNKWESKKAVCCAQDGSGTVGAFQPTSIPAEVTGMDRALPPAKRLKQANADYVAKLNQSSVCKKDVQAQAPPPPILLQYCRLSSSKANTNRNRGKTLVGEEPGESSTKHESAIQQNPTSNTPAANPQSDQSRSLPFTMTSKLWKVYESLEVFKRIPQRPHFSPLSELHESTREEEAFCMMTKFAFVVSKITEGSRDDLQSIRVIRDRLDYLKKMESHGFNTMRFQVYLKNLFEKKEKEEELIKNLEEAETKVCELRGQLKSVQEQFQLEKSKNHLNEEDLTTMLEPEDTVA